MAGAMAPPTPRAGPATVLHLLSSGAARGTAHAQIVATLARGLDPSRYRLVAWFLIESGPLGDMLERSGVATRAVGFRGATDPIGALRFVQALLIERPALIHLHVPGRARVRLARSTKASRLVAHLHGTHAEDCTPLAVRQFALSSDTAIGVSNAATAGAPGAMVVYPGIEVPANTRSAGPVGPPIIGTVARLEPIKGLDTLLKAAAALHLRHPSVRIELAGTGSDEPRLKALARKLGISDAVDFLGWREDVRALHSRWFAFAAPSIHEGFGLAALEAMASRVPVVASATGGLMELIDDPCTGFLIPVGDVGALTERLDLLLTDPSLRARMGDAAADRVHRKFTTERMVDGIAAVYRRLLAS